MDSCIAANILSVPRTTKHITSLLSQHPQFQFKFKMSSLKQLIYNALFKAATLKTGEKEVEYPTPEAAREAYIKLVFAELFPGEAVPTAPTDAVVVAESPKKKAKKAKKEEEPVPEPKVESPKKVKKAAKKAEAAASPVVAPAASVLVEETAPEEVTVPMPVAAGAGSPKKAKKAKQTAEEKEAAKAEAKAAKEAEKAKAKEDAKAAKEAEKVKAKEAAKAAKEAEKAKAKADLNVQKIDPTWRKALKEAEKDKEKAKEHEAPLLAYLNAMSNVAFNSKGAKEHVAAFLSSLATPAPAVELVETNLEVVEFEGKDYYVNPETKRVYEGELDEEGTLKVTRPVGYVGMADFKDMKLE